MVNVGFRRGSPQRTAGHSPSCGDSPVSRPGTLRSVAAAGETTSSGDDPERTPGVEQADLQTFVDEARRSEAAEARRREQWLRRQSEEEGTFHGLLVDLTERATALAVHTRADRVVRGHPVVLGADFLVVEGTNRSTSLVPLHMVVGVTPEPGSPSTLGDRPQTTTGTLARALADLVVDRPQVDLHTSQTRRVSGTLWSLGHDFVTVRSPAGDTYVPLAAVNDLIWR